MLAKHRLRTVLSSAFGVWWQACLHAPIPVRQLLNLRAFCACCVHATPRVRGALACCCGPVLPALMHCNRPGSCPVHCVLLCGMALLAQQLSVGGMAVAAHLALGRFSMGSVLRQLSQPAHASRDCFASICHKLGPAPCSSHAPTSPAARLHVLPALHRRCLPIGAVRNRRGCGVCASMHGAALWGCAGMLSRAHSVWHSHACACCVRLVCCRERISSITARASGVCAERAMLMYCFVSAAAIAQRASSPARRQAGAQAMSLLSGPVDVGQPPGPLSVMVVLCACDNQHCLARNHRLRPHVRCA